ncbi:type I-E CRISPR-associated protein Cse2/CasB [Streptomyces sp. NPDC020681]|uniref:type I-E CRISPR-associated protein Cse2/CasB n=1 Tax=Streptomyces sp. NPDC020681 TaxID=3365083 RepID=UPI0037A4B503
MTGLPTDQPQAADQRRSEAYVTYVLKLCDNKRTRSDLRSGLGRPVQRCNYLHRYLVPYLPEQQHRDTRRAHYAIAALIAGRPRASRDADATADQAQSPTWWKRPNLGASLANAVRKGTLKPDSAEGELHLLTRQSSDAIHIRLPALTRHLLTSGVPIDWAVLLEDLTWWNRNQDQIATRWLEAYFRVLSTQDATTNPQENNA